MSRQANTNKKGVFYWIQALFCIFVLAIIILIFGNQIHNKIAGSKEPELTEWRTYTSTEPRFTVKYPPDYQYVLVNSVESNQGKNALQIVHLKSKSIFGSSITGVEISVYDAKGESDIRNWVSKYATSISDNYDSKDNKYIIYSVKNPKESSIFGKDTYTYYGEYVAKGSDIRLVHTLIMTSSYIFEFTHFEGKVDDIYQKVIESLVI